MATGLAALRLLVIDDNAQMRSIIGTVLTAAGIGHLHYAPDGLRGLEALASLDVDVVYVDYEMPVMNGLDFLSTVRSPGFPKRLTPIIMLTGHADMYRLNGARDRGVNEFLCKPVTARAILSRLEAVIFRERPFVTTGDYFGPDRRRRKGADYSGPFRRAADSQSVFDLDS